MYIYICIERERERVIRNMSRTRSGRFGLGLVNRWLEAGEGGGGREGGRERGRESEGGRQIEARERERERGREAWVL